MQISFTFQCLFTSSSEQNGNLNKHLNINKITHDTYNNKDEKNRWIPEVSQTRLCQNIVYNKT